jgi:hypothetical protein
MNNHNLILLSTPYSDPDVEVKKDRKHKAALMVMKLFHQNVFTFSPIAYGLAVIEETDADVPDTWDFWQNYCVATVTGCSMVFVLDIPGWRESKGVAGEIATAKAQGKMVYLIEYNPDPKVPLKILDEL